MHVASLLPSLYGDICYQIFMKPTTICLGWWEMMYNEELAPDTIKSTLCFLLQIIPGKKGRTIGFSLL